ncbi:MAG: tetratricopeptide repeat protein [Sedimentisphaerales bacterium]|nr:tetratricopeptide repeat protein [Sedimentisphaerales bacterium]
MTKEKTKKGKKQKRWHERTSVTLCVAAILILIGFGFIHIVTGVMSSYCLPFVVTYKKSFGYRETFVDAEKITSIPYVIAKKKYPIGCKVLQRLEYMESGDVFETVMVEQLREAMRIWQAEFEEALNEQPKQWYDEFRKSNEVTEENNAEVLNDNGIAAALEGRYETAISEFTRALRKNPVYIDAYFNRGLVYTTIGQSGSAISDFTQIVEIDTEFVEAYAHRGRLYVTSGRYDEAVADCTKLLEFKPDYIEIYFMRALVFFAQGLYDKAWSDVHKIQNMELSIPSGFLKNLRRASETD